MSKIKKIIIVCFAFFLIFCSTFIVFGAEWVTTGDNIIGDFEIAYVGFQVDGVNTSCTFAGESQLDGIRLRVQTITESNVSTSKDYKVRIMFKCNNPAFYNSNSNVYLEWMIWAYSDRVAYQPNTRAWRSSILNSAPAGDYQIATNKFTTSGNQNRYYVNYNSNSIGHSYQYYYFEFDVKSLVSSTTQMSFYFTMPEVEIITSEQSAQRDEKNEASQTGNDGADELGSVIPNDSQGFIDSIGNLVGSMSYTGTECNWELPSVSLPKIDGVMPSIKLWDKQEIPFEYWIGKIPSGIMTLVQSLLTIALIIYCFKELYSVISYVLTLKGGGANE